MPTSVSPSGLPSLHRKSALQPRAKSPGLFFAPLQSRDDGAARIQGPFLRASRTPTRSTGPTIRRHSLTGSRTSAPGPAARDRRRDRQRPGGDRARGPLRRRHRNRAFRGAACARRAPHPRVEYRPRARRGDFRRGRHRRTSWSRPRRRTGSTGRVRRRGAARAAPGRRARDLDLWQLPTSRPRSTGWSRISRATSSGPTGRASAAMSTRAIAISSLPFPPIERAGFEMRTRWDAAGDAGLPRHLVRRAPLPRTDRARSARPARRAARGGLGRRRAGHALAADRSGLVAPDPRLVAARNPAAARLPYTPRPPRLEIRNVPAQAAARRPVPCTSPVPPRPTTRSRAARLRHRRHRDGPAVSGRRTTCSAT